jgi:hypothetical protein
MTEAERRPNEGAAPSRPRSLLRRVPTSLIVTLVGIALTAWLLPAFTRQWDDRQKAHDLKAVMVTDMAASTARALAAGKPARAASDTQEVDAKRRDEWALASVEIEARLRAYFPGSLVAAWQIYAYFVDEIRGVDAAQTDATLSRALDWMYPTRPNEVVIQGRADPRRHIDWEAGHTAALALAMLEQRELKTHAPPPSSKSVHLRRVFVDVEKRYSRGDFNIEFIRQAHDDRDLETQLLGLEEEIATQALRSHLTGYSTSAGDFLHDLIP